MIRGGLRDRVPAGQHRGQHVVAQRRGGGDEARHRYHRLAQSWPQVAGVAVRREHHEFATNRRPLGAHRPAGAIVQDRSGGARSVDGRALFDRSSREPARIRERLHAAPARIVHSGVVAPRADERRDLVSFEEARPAPSLRPLASPFPVEAAPLGAVSALHVARAQRLAFDPVALDELEDEVAAPVAEFEETLSPHRAQGRDDVIGQHLHAARVHLPAVAARASPARLAGVEHHHPPAGPGEMERGRKPRVAGPDHGHVGAVVRIERRALGAGGRGGCPQAVVHRRHRTRFRRSNLQVTHRPSTGSFRSVMRTVAGGSQDLP